MKGVVPQKGLKMKLSINPGPCVDRTNYEFVVSSENCKKLSDFIWDWKDSLPLQISRYIQVITVNPTHIVNVPMAMIIKVVISGEVYGRRWETNFERVFVYSEHDGVRVHANELTNSIRRALEAEINIHQPILAELGSMVEHLAVHY